MFSHYVIFLIVLSHRAHQHAYASSLDVLLKLEKTFCPYRRYCNASSSSDTPSLDASQRPCCLNCSCADDCYQYDNCCPDKAAQDANLTAIDGDGERSRETTIVKARFACQTPQLIPTLQTDLEAKSYYMINRCNKRYLGLRRIIKCEKDLTFGSILEQIPLYVPEKNILYKNVHCAVCNFERIKKARFAEANLRCQQDVFGEFIGLGEPADIFAFIIDNRVPACNIFFEVPNDLENPDLGVTECSPVDVSACNMTGIWKLYDAELEDVCRNYYAPWTSARPDRSQTVYKNLACLKCNHNYVEHLADCPKRNNPPLPVDVKLNINSKLIQDSEKRAGPVIEMNDVNSQSDRSCRWGQLLDVHKVRYLEHGIK